MRLVTPPAPPGPPITRFNSGARSLLLPEAVRACRWRVRVTGARGAVRIAEFVLYRSRV
ncbi:hypothetical protein [Streptomyces sp. SudanB52_2052]|uniref:hypothetical protein n=1 Tax=Streptomyces sp. SudanB52_2052 TaxID=3035276 RepID=UPI003F55F61C